MTSRREKLAKTTLVLALSLAVLAPLAGAAEVRAVHVKQGPKVDGLLSDAVWSEAPAFSDFRMVEPRPDQEPTERTEIRVLYDEANLYIGVHCFDREPRRVAANTLAHDAGSEQGMSYGGYGHMPSSSSDDGVKVLLDPFQNKRTAYIFSINPRGARSEGLITGGQSSLNWDGIWEGRARILDDGWSAEFRIPFKTISFRPGLTTWGINVERTIARKQETIRMSGTGRDSNFYSPMEAAGLTGIEGVRQGLGITVRPYGLGSAHKNFDAGTHEEKLEGGVDVYKNFTPNLVGVISTNMDFAETEADDRRINLTRFPLFYPEKRMFFLEGSETFSFSSSVSFQPFISRSIGLYQGAQVPVLFGTKLYGKVGQTNIAVLDAQTGKSGDLGGQNLLAARMTQNVFAESKVGWIFTNGSPTGGRNSLAGVDFQYSSSRFLGNKNVMLAAWGAYNWNDEPGRHHGFGFRAGYPNDLWNIQSTYAWYGEGLDPGLGYMMRSAMQTGFLSVSYQPRPRGGPLAGLVRQFFFSASGDYYWDLRGNLETSRINLTALAFRTHSGDQFGFGINPGREVLTQDFEIARGVVLAPGSYSFTNYSFSFNSASHRLLALQSSYTFGGFYSGHYNEATAGVAVKLKGYVSLTGNVDLVRARLPEGNFSENVYQLKADFFLSPDLGLMNYIQFDDISNQLGWSARLRWQVSPGNEVYLVFNKNWERRWDPSARLFPMEQKGVLKVTLSIRP
ncbi:MAG TPA: carbohydrate binding family 9 domain-containing protein [Terriglobales bacterium]|nr:carbohydrate binding family 9 domain-containing protein [Terriglobales bacterium]